MSNPFKFTDLQGEDIKVEYEKRLRNHIPYFDNGRGKSKSKYTSTRTKVFFDTETYLYYETPESEPLIVPYLIGVCDNIDKANSYKYFLSDNATKDFFDYILGDKKDSLSNKKRQLWKQKDGEWIKNGTVVANKVMNLYAFNISYDFHSLRIWFEKEYKKDIYLSYTMGTDKKFVTGKISHLRKDIEIDFKDLWMWDRSKGLGRRINDIRDIVWKKDPVDKDKGIEKLNYREDNNGKKVDDPILDTLLKTIKAYGLDYHTFKKGTLGEDYTKINLHKKGDDYYYGPSKESGEQEQPPKKLDITKEIEYLRIDVMAMPVIEKGEELMRKEAKNALELTNVKRRDCSITAPGFVKYLLEEYSNGFVRHFWRAPVKKEEYEEMLLNYTGAFTASNPNILYFDEAVFNEMYPDKSFYDEKGNPRITAYDINSMYPYVMHMGIPYGDILYVEPEGVEGVDYCTWYCVNFYDAVDINNRVIYDGKKKYKCFNNSFFGNNFILGCGELAKRKYILKELYELFIVMNDHKTRIVSKCYQRLDKEVLPKFIEPLYNIKSDNEGKSEGQRAICKLMMNSLYGKMAEKYRTAKIVFSTDLKRTAMEYTVEVMLNHPEKEFYIYKQLDNKELNEIGSVGFMRLENMDKRFCINSMEGRESIMPGMYITQKSRWLLLSSVKTEIDQGNLFLNCDTDSMKIVQINPPKIGIDSKKMGAWKYEGAFTHFGHPNMLKKYFLFNMLSKSPKPDKWGKMASGGIPNNKIWPTDVSKEELLNMWKTIYDVNNRVVVREAKNTCTGTKGAFQPIINTVDIEVIGGMDIDITHEVKGKRVYEIK